MNRRKVLSMMSLAAGMGGLDRLSAQTLAPPGTLVGLAVGIDQYQHLTPLQTAHQDANAVAARLSAIGYDVEPHPAVSTTDGIVASFAQFLQKVDSSSAAFLFLAGHGVQVEGRNYYLPSNIPVLDNADALVDALPLNFFLDALAKAQPRQSIVVLDACRDNAVGKEMPGFSRGIASTNAPTGCFIAYSAGFGEFALDRLADDDSSPNGLFTRHLLQHMNGERRIHDIIVSTRADVIAEAEAIGHAQHPAIYDQSRRPYFLDGVERRDAGAIPDVSGTLEGTGIILAAADEYSYAFRPLRSPKPDGVRLHRVLTGLGASVVGLLNPSRDEVLDACEQMAARGFAQYAFVWLGRGQMRQVQATGMLETGDFMGVTRGKDQGTGGLEMFSHSDVIEKFRPSADQKDHEKSAAPTAGNAPLTLFFDCGLERGSEPASSNAYSAQVPLNDLPNDFMLDGRFHDIALMAATRPGQAKPASAERDQASAFVTALINGLGRPGLSVLDLSELVAAEVKSLSEGAQEPVLVASPKAARRPFVRRNSGGNPG